MLLLNKLIRPCSLKLCKTRLFRFGCLTLTRFTSKGEQLECFCGSPSCRGFVNVNDDEETSKILVPCREIMAWTPLAS